METKDLCLRIKQKGRSAKFYSRYVGPFEITKSEPKTSNYTGYAKIEKIIINHRYLEKRREGPYLCR